MNRTLPPATRVLPQFYLRCEIEPADLPGHWRFELTRPDGTPGVEAADVEPGVSGPRLELLTVVRALESLDERSRITLMNPSATLRQGILYGLAEWQSNGWRWERFGQLVPIKNLDLWQRLDQAMRFHEVECRRWQIHSAHPTLRGPTWLHPSPTMVGSSAEDEPVLPNPSDTATRLVAIVGLCLAALMRTIHRARRALRAYTHLAGGVSGTAEWAGRGNPSDGSVPHGLFAETPSLAFAAGELASHRLSVEMARTWSLSPSPQPLSI